MTEAGRIYGGALYSLAREEGLSQIIFDQLNVLSVSFAQEPDLVRLLSTPALSKAARCQILDDCFRGRVHAYVLHFLKLLTEKGYMRHFSDCAVSYQAIFYRDKGILPVTATTAVALTEAQAARLTRKIASITGKRIALTNRSDPAVLGGIRLDFDGKRLDGTVSHRLDAVGSMLQNTVL